jgi:NADH:ubiquinone oxidoreductase subunit 5 (subunit L)/multisubunit Na+/H+ antiporter MnhA subunit
LTGPTLAFREIDRQLRVRDASGGAVLRGTLLKKELFGLPATSLAVLLLLAAALARTASILFGARPAEAGSTRPAASALLALFGVGSGAILAVRIAFLAELVPGVAGVMAALASLVALACALRALYRPELKPALALVAGSQIALAIAGAAAGADSAAAVQLAVTMLALTALLGGGRAFQFGLLALAAAPIPAIGLFWSRDALLWALASTAQSARLVGTIAYLLGIAASALAALALWRFYFRGSAPKPAPKRDRFALVAAGLALAVGLLAAPLGDPAREQGGAWLFGERELPLPIDRSLRFGSLLLGFALPLGGFLLARRRPEPPAVGRAWLGRLPATAIGARIDSGIERAGALVARADQAIERALGDRRGSS